MDARKRSRSVGDSLFSARKMKTTEPNQALEPTPIAVTPRADARVAPATAVAHL